MVKSGGWSQSGGIGDFGRRLGEAALLHCQVRAVAALLSKPEGCRAQAGAEGEPWKASLSRRQHGEYDPADARAQVVLHEMRVGLGHLHGRRRRKSATLGTRQRATAAPLRYPRGESSPLGPGPPWARGRASGAAGWPNGLAGCKPGGCEPSGCEPSGCEPSGCMSGGWEPGGCELGHVWRAGSRWRGPGCRAASRRCAGRSRPWARTACGTPPAHPAPAARGSRVSGVWAACGLRVGWRERWAVGGGPGGWLGAREQWAASTPRCSCTTTRSL